MTAVMQAGDKSQQSPNIQKATLRASERLKNVNRNEILLLLNQYGILPQFVREIMIDCAIAEIAIAEDEALGAYKKFYQQHQLDSEEDLQAWLNARGISREQLEYIATRGLKLAKFQEQTWGNKLESYFLGRKQKLDRVVYSLIRVKDPYLAQELYFRVQEGEQSFSEIAREYSEGPEAETGGLLGPVDLGVPHPALAKMLLRSKPGELLAPTRLGDWVVVVRLEKYLPAQLDEVMRQRLLSELFDQWVRTEGSSVIQEQLSSNTNELKQEGTEGEQETAVRK
ncbi:peptidylprolyl isomerase [Mastigocoleus sp. MO_188.B34]|uniref:peptidylprolyl isomerase n=1 Tax=Mastigocoleus sp. MO_188.B34 TaxID=3036635 RepID=UPI00261DD611|nr:peptidylprolyl isomerase [Mastigocoleus sp. MO_188.B34]MDJ0696229.1 peptidylprolyl isomerase [Mastigocoleus sp. MO_188.B34]